MLRFTEVVTIDAPVADIVRVVSAVEGWPAWHPAVSRVDRRGSGPLSVGETVTVKQPRLPVATWTVTAVDPSGFAWQSSSPGVRSTGEHWVRATDGGRADAELTLALSGPLARVVALIYGRLIRRYVRLEAEALWHTAEQRHRAGGHQVAGPGTGDPETGAGERAGTGGPGDDDS